MHFIDNRWYIENIDIPEQVSLSHAIGEAFQYGLTFGWHALMCLGAAQYGIFIHATERVPRIPHGIAASDRAFEHLRIVVEHSGGNFTDFLLLAQTIEHCVVAINEYVNTTRERMVYVADAKRTYDEIIRHMRAHIVL